MKVIGKSGMLKNCQEGHIRAERDFLVQAESTQSPWIVSLFGAFQDNTSLYLIMEFMVGGDFLGVLLREEVLHEDIARWYAAEMVLAIEAVHKLMWIHRDVKPDNFLISSSGHLKISDFGLAFDGHWSHCQTFYADKRQHLLDKFGIEVTGDAQDAQDAQEAIIDSPMRDVCHDTSTASNKHQWATLDTSNSLLASLRERRRFAKSIVGTSQYMAPEIVLGEAYDGRCDWWSLGIIVYEMLYGYTPFYDECRMQTKENIVAYATTLDFPPGTRWGRPNTEEPEYLAALSDDAVDLMQGLVTHRSQRLGSAAYTSSDRREKRRDSGFSTTETAHVKAFDADEVKAHPFFAQIPWSVMHLRPPPWVPAIQLGQSITKYFEDEQDIVEMDMSHKRARDKILRDPTIGPTAMEERRKTAFVGYTYRRPIVDTKVPLFGRPRANPTSSIS